MIPTMENGMAKIHGLGVGIDLVSVTRIEQIVEKWGAKFLRRVFTDGEIAYSTSRARPALSFAARFAAKEAFFKAVSRRKVGGIGFKHIEVVIGEDGIPSLVAHGPARRALAADSAALSISHDRELAVAVVVTSPEVEV
jgi:holo-[acyl-carrier protein] synthase